MVYTPDNKFNGQENGFVTITYPNGTKKSTIHNVKKFNNKKKKK